MRFVSDTELATLTPAEQRDVASPIPTQVVSQRRIHAAAAERGPARASKRASARWPTSWRRNTA